MESIKWTCPVPLHLDPNRGERPAQAYQWTKQRTKLYHTDEPTPERVSQPKTITRPPACARSRQYEMPLTLKNSNQQAHYPASIL